MSEEEKEAIDILQNSIADYVIGEYCERCGDRLICNDRNEDCYFQQAIDKVVNLIDKLLEKNEALKEKLKSKEKQIKLMQEMNLPDEIEKNYISKDKIRTKIKELDKKRNYIHSMYTSNVLEELLGDDE